MSHGHMEIVGTAIEMPSVIIEISKCTRKTPSICILKLTMIYYNYILLSHVSYLSRVIYDFIEFKLTV